MPGDLPPELWREIASHLPTRVLAGLLSVNRPFLQLALEIRYGSVSLCVSSWSRFERQLAAISYPHSIYIYRLATTVSIASIGPDEAWPGLAFHRSPGLSTTSADPPSTPGDSLGNISLQRIIAMLQKFTRLQELRLELDYPFWPQDEALGTISVLGLAAPCWATLGPHLQTLVLQISPAHLPLFLIQDTTTSSELHALRHLKLELCNSRSCTTKRETKAILKFLYPFINGISSSLQSLSMTKNNKIFGSPLDLSFLEGLHELSSLTTLNIDIDISRDHSTLEAKALKDFISLYSPRLQALRLQLSTPSSLSEPPSFFEQSASFWFSKHLTSINFPALQRFEIYPTRWPNGFSGMLHMVSQCANTLEALSVRHTVCTTSELDQLVDSLYPSEGAESDSKLWMLDITLSHFSVDSLRKLASRLPSLRTLVLRLHEPSVPPEEIAALKVFAREVIDEHGHRKVLGQLQVLEIRTRYNMEFSAEVLEILRSTVPGCSVAHCREWEEE